MKCQNLLSQTQKEKCKFHTFTKIANPIKVTTPHAWHETWNNHFEVPSQKLLGNTTTITKGGHHIGEYWGSGIIKSAFHTHYSFTKFSLEISLRSRKKNKLSQLPHFSQIPSSKHVLTVIQFLEAPLDLKLICLFSTWWLPSLTLNHSSLCISTSAALDPEEIIRNLGHQA